MSINVDLLIAAPMLQDYLVDKDGTPMALGTITCYQDNSRTTLKNWYYQSGTPGNYTYIKLPNPLTLSAAGTICDLNGVDTIPFFYPYSELDDNEVQPYYITIVNAALTNEITRSNFPFLPPSGNAPSTSNSFDNYIINNEFWRNIGTMSLTNTLLATVAPSQHDGFNNPDITFQKNITGGQDTVTFMQFPLTTTPILDGDITPEFYLNHTCSNTPTGETQKAYYFPISLHVNTLASVPFTATIQGQNIGGTAPGQNIINLYIYQFTGTGTTSPAPFLIGSISLTTAWQKYEFSSIFPPTAGLTLGAGGDDALYLVVQMPLDMNCSINFAKPSIYLSQTVPTNNFQTYDQIDSIISSPRTGDMRTSLNSFYPFGWVPMDDGTLGNASSNATARAAQDTWPLFNLLWNSFAPYNQGTTNPLAQMFNSSGVAIAYGASAIADFSANNAISLTKTLGKVLLGTVPVTKLGSLNTSTFTSAANAITASHNMALFNGAPVYFPSPNASLPGGLSVGVVYYVANFNGANIFNLASSFTNAIQGTILTFGSGSGTINAKLAGTFEGEYAHTQLLNEMINHTHGLSGFAGLANNAPSAAGITDVGTFAGSTVTLGVTGYSAQSPFNVTQPGVFFNMYMKL